MSHWKKILLTSAVLVVLLIMAVNLFLLLYDFNRLKPTIARAVNDATGRELTIAGNIEFRFRPWPTLVVDGAGLQNASWGSTPDLARVKHLEVQINVWQLIFGKFDFSRLVLVEPNVIVEFNVTGASNFSFDTAGEETDELALSPPPLIFSQVLIENGLFTYKDAQSSFKLSIRIDRMTAEIPGFDKSLQIDFKGAYNDLPFTLNGTVGPIWAWVVPGYALPANITVAAGGATANVKGEMRDPTHLKDLAFSVNAEGPSIAGVAKLAGVADIPELGAFNVAAKVSDLQGILENFPQAGRNRKHFRCAQLLRDIAAGHPDLLVDQLACMKYGDPVLENNRYHAQTVSRDGPDLDDILDVCHGHLKGVGNEFLNFLGRK